MCAPLAVALPIAGAVASAAGTMVGGLHANAQSKYEANVYGQNAKLATEAARDSQERGRVEARRFWREAGAVKGQQAASMAANGLDLSFGTPTRLERDTAEILSEDAATLYRNIDERTRGYDIEFVNQTGAGRAARARGKQALVSAGFQSFATLAKAAGSAHSLMSSMEQQPGLRAKGFG